VNLVTREKTEHRNATVAGEACGVSQGSVSVILSGRRRSENGFWFTHDPNAEPPTRFGKASVRFHKEQPVMATEIKSGRQTAFRSAKAASEALLISGSLISRILKSGVPKRSAKGYTFEAIEKDKWRALQADGDLVE
jgi:hypothetical protein